MHMNAVTMRLSGPSTARALRAKLGAALRPIRVGPGLLVYLDQAKRQRLLKRWNAALSGN
ncbi:MAG: ABC transporter substrate-binding protein, partial [Hyphomicrobiaceae bacterium]